MELTQRFELTQDLHQSFVEKVIPEQIGFLGICGNTYSLKKGPNKIGRDPSTCQIVLDLNSISRHHAVINVLNKHEVMLMDLDSANKTKLCGKTLQPYLPSPLRNGDTVQFGLVFGVFRLLEEENDLPMTQAIEIPETPVQSRHIAKLNTHTTIPESPDISDKDDSIIGASQSKLGHIFKSPNNKLLKMSGKSITIKPIGTNKIDNAYWNTKSDSFTLDTSNPPNIHELDTQLPCDNENENAISLNNSHTELKENRPLEIFEMETQLPEVCKVESQQNLQYVFTTDNKENENNIFIAETQLPCDANISSKNNLRIDQKESEKSTSLNSEKSTDNLNISNDVILFDEIESCETDDFLNSQSIVAAIPDDLIDEKISPGVIINGIEEKAEEDKIPSRRLSSSSTDCEDDIYIAMTQKIVEEQPHDDLTDCEDELEVISKNNGNQEANVNNDETDCEDDLVVVQHVKISENLNLEEMVTQVLKENSASDHVNFSSEEFKKPIPFEEMLTQVIGEDKTDLRQIEALEAQALVPQNKVVFEEALTQQIYSEEVIKMPPPFQKKKRQINDLEQVSKIIQNNYTVDEENDIYYAETQQLYDDLCSQKEDVSKIFKQPPVHLNTKVLSLKSKSPNQSKITKKKSMEQLESDIDEKINRFVSKLTVSEIMDVVGVNKSNALVKEKCPKNADQEIISVTRINTDTSVKNSNIIDKTNNNSLLSLKDKEYKSKTKDIYKNKTENTSSTTTTKNQRRKSSDIRTYLNKSDKTETKSHRSSSRVRKLTSKMQNTDEECQKLCSSMFKSKIVKDKDDKQKQAVTDNTPSENKSNNKIELVDKKSKTNNEKQENEKTNKESTTVNKKSECKPRRSKRKKEPDEDYQPEIAQSKNRDKKTNENRSLRSRNKKIEDTKNSKSLLNDDDRMTERVTEKFINKETNKTRSSRNSKESYRSSNRESKSLTKEESNKEIIIKDKNKRRHSKDKEKDSPEIRRSKRQKTSKKSEEPPNEKIREKTNSNESTVYNISSESGIDSPNKLKRSGDFRNLDVSKRNFPVRPTSARGVKTHYVLFTAFPCEEVKVKLEKLGAIIVTDVAKCTVVLTIQIKRTFKLLCAVGLGKPIVGPAWVQACVDTNIIVDPWLYLIKDKPTEERFQFNLERSLVGKRNFLSGYNISSTSNVMPNPQELKLIVECSGGTWKDRGPLWVCVSSSADRNLWPDLKKKGAIIVSTEFILSGVLRQKLDLERNRLA